jgi:hypothetical protein
MFAVSTLSPGWQAIFYLIAGILFVVGAVGWKAGSERVKLESLGLAFFVFPFFWNAWAAS